MNLSDEIKRINPKEGKTRLTVTLTDGTVFTGVFEGYTSAINNDPPTASIDLDVDADVYELYEDEMKSINSES